MWTLWSSRGRAILSLSQHGKTPVINRKASSTDQGQWHSRWEQVSQLLPPHTYGQRGELFPSARARKTVPAHSSTIDPDIRASGKFTILSCVHPKSVCCLCSLIEHVRCLSQGLPWEGTYLHWRFHLWKLIDAPLHLVVGWLMNKMWLSRGVWFKPAESVTKQKDVATHRNIWNHYHQDPADQGAWPLRSRCIQLYSFMPWLQPKAIPVWFSSLSVLCRHLIV